MTDQPVGASSERFPQTLLNIGFLFALALAGACLVMSAWYLFSFLQATNSGVESVLRSALQDPNTPAGIVQLSILARTAMGRFALLSCGVTVGMSFGFLGFALFLLGIKGEMDVAAQSEKTEIKIARMAPGVFVILCAAILVGVCTTFRTEYEIRNAEGAGSRTAAQPGGAGTSDNLPKQKPGEIKP